VRIVPLSQTSLKLQDVANIDDADGLRRDVILYGFGGTFQARNDSVMRLEILHGRNQFTGGADWYLLVVRFALHNGYFPVLMQDQIDTSIARSWCLRNLIPQASKEVRQFAFERHPRQCPPIRLLLPSLFPLFSCLFSLFSCHPFVVFGDVFAIAVHSRAIPRCPTKCRTNHQSDVVLDAAQHTVKTHCQAAAQQSCEWPSK
jgi:hypothetical protein